MTIYIFNPENDMALADGTAGYTPPATIQQMRRELYWLPNWWAGEGDIVWDGEQKLSLSEGDTVSPWGWSPALVHQLRGAGVGPEFMPTREQLDYIRRLSHRQTAVEALARQREDGLLDGRLRGRSVVCRTWEEVREAVGRWDDTILKMPWSSSGRGLMTATSPNLEAWCRRVIRQQGAVVAEERLPKVADFAMEFHCDGRGGVEYRGLSLFFTGEYGSYSGNWVAPEIQKFTWLTQYMPPQALVDIRRWWEQYLTRFAYSGPVGVDMMLCRDGICPCIEINWRMTMGMVANIAASQGRYGKLIVEYIYGHYSAEVEAFG